MVAALSSASRHELSDEGRSEPSLLSARCNGVQALQPRTKLWQELHQLPPTARPPALNSLPSLSASFPSLLPSIFLPFWSSQYGSSRSSSVSSRGGDVA